MTSQNSPKNSEPAASAGQVQSLTRALNLLQHVAASDMGLTLSALAKDLHMAPSTAHRLLNSLLSMGFVEFEEGPGIWTVGVQAFSVGNAYLKKRDFIVQARPHMKELMARTGETCNLAILENDQVVFVGQVECKEVMRMVVQVGGRGPVHASGVGKALLSAMPREAALEVLARHTMPALTERTFTSPDAISAELDQIAQQGYAVDDEEQSIGLRCIAANIYDEFAEAIAAISISGPVVRVNRARMDQMARDVQETADRVTAVIGGRKPS